MNNITATIDGNLFEGLLTHATARLYSKIKEINELNVFPVPDGDTGSNMYSTLSGGVEYMKKESNHALFAKANALAEGMLLSARGNSGVILSQLFFGIAKGLNELEQATANQFSNALKVGVEYGYKAVLKPVEGTILTVAREGVEKINLFENITLEEFFAQYLNQLKISLLNTPNLLAVLKESNVVDSGGAGLVCIAEGFYSKISGEEINEEIAFTSFEPNNGEQIQFAFDENSKMDYGYCTEILLQLIKDKCESNPFDLEKLKEFLTDIGDSVVAVETGGKVKIHVHTLTPCKVLEKCHAYGEFISVKIENMTVQHNGLMQSNLQSNVKNREEEPVECAIIAVASGGGMANLYIEYGADYVVSGGQTDNPSAEDFIKGFKKVNAKNIIVLPNNKNIILAAKQAADLYKESSVIVLPTKTPQQVYSALMVVTDKQNVKQTTCDMQEAISGVESYSLTYSIRDAVINGVSVKKGDYIFLSENQLLCANENKQECLKGGFSKIEQIEDKEIITVFYGKDITNQEKEDFCALIGEICPDSEVIEYEGEQEIYSYLIAVE